MQSHLPTFQSYIVISTTFMHWSSFFVEMQLMQHQIVFQWLHLQPLEPHILCWGAPCWYWDLQTGFWTYCSIFMQSHSTHFTIICTVASTTFMHWSSFLVQMQLLQDQSAFERLHLQPLEPHISCWGAPCWYWDLQTGLWTYCPIFMQSHLPTLQSYIQLHLPPSCIGAPSLWRCSCCRIKVHLKSCVFSLYHHPR
jgi:hypothetical protein